MATKTNKTALAPLALAQAEVSSLKSQLAQQQALSLRNAQLAIEFSNASLAIDQRLMSSTFKGDIKKKLFWVIANWKELLAIVEFIIAQVKAVKDRIKALEAEAQALTNGK